VKRPWIHFAFWFVAIAGGLALRTPHLDSRPMHADEAVQAARFRELWLEGTYRYDPHEYHGPTLMYATLPSVLVSGATTPAETTEVTYRVVPVAFGVGMLLLFSLLCDALGRAGSLWAALLAGCSPALVFYSRYYIHETLLAFFTLATIVLVWRYYQSGRLRWCVAAGVTLGLMQATKETAAITYLAGVAALGVAVVTARRGETHVSTFRWRWTHAVWGAIAALATAAILLSSLGANPRGIVDGVLTYVPWLSRAGGQSPHIHPWSFYLTRLVWWRVGDGPRFSESLIVGLSLIGCVRSLVPLAGSPGGPHAGFARWLAWFTIFITAIYCVIPYKTPWCLLQFWVGMIMLAGIGARTLIDVAHWPTARFLTIVLLLSATGHLAWQAYRASYVMAADPRNPYVYAHTSADVTRLADQLRQLAEASAQQGTTPLKIIWTDAYYWPLPWYLRDFSQVQWWTEVPADPLAPIVISATQHDESLTPQLEATHIMTGYFQLRPRVLMQLWVRLDLWEAHLRRLGRL